MVHRLADRRRIDPQPLSIAAAPLISEGLNRRNEEGRVSEERVTLELLGARTLALTADIRDVKLRLTGLETRLTGLENRFAGLENRFAAMENRFAALENRIGVMDERISGLVSLVVRIAERLDGTPIDGRRS
jgi:predicted nuclease with TOPRIM domain